MSFSGIEALPLGPLLQPSQQQGKKKRKRLLEKLTQPK